MLGFFSLAAPSTVARTDEDVALSSCANPWSFLTCLGGGLLLAPPQVDLLPLVPMPFVLLRPELMPLRRGFFPASAGAGAVLG